MRTVCRSGQEDARDVQSRRRSARFYADWYRPDLMAIVAVGDFDPAQIEQLHQEPPERRAGEA